MAMALGAPLAAAPLPQAPAASPTAQVVAAPVLDSARGAMRDGRVEEAVRYAERYSSRNPRDPRGYVALGDAYLRRQPAGRFNALRAYEEAMRLAPDDPEPAYLYAQAGLFLGGDDGEAVARRGLERTLAFDPLFRDAWTQWLTLFRNDDARRRMRETLAPFAAAAAVRGRIALLFIEDERYAQADSVLDGLLSEDSSNAAWLALRAQSAYEAGDTAAGGVYYRRALAHAARDGGATLWQQAVGVARPDEVRAWDDVPPERRGAWLEAFWARRSADLFAGAGGRVAEHFARLRYARRSFPLRHPLVSYHRSRLARALDLQPASGERDFHDRCEAPAVPVQPDAMGRSGADPEVPWMLFDQSAPAGGGPARAGADARVGARRSETPWDTRRDDDAGAMLVSDAFRAALAPLNLDLGGADTAAARLGHNLVTGLDDRGLVYLRFGAPDRLEVGGRNDDPTCRTGDVERWSYQALGELRFARPGAFARGERTVSEMVFRPMTDRQAGAMRAALSGDAPPARAGLPFGVWTAQFAAGRPGAANVVVVGSRGRLAATLVSPERGAGDLRRGPAGVVVLEADPGRYLLLAHAQDSGRLGRQEVGLTARGFLRRPNMSDLLLAPAWAGPATFIDMLRRVRRGLDFPAGSAIRAYAEVYGLEAVAGAVRYQADYLLLRSDDAERDAAREEWPAAVRLSFERVAPAGVVVREVLDLTPERLPAGTWLLRLTVRDLAGGEVAGQATIGFVVR